MSGLGGFCHWDGRPVVSDRLSELAVNLQVAGPDGSGTIQPAPWLALQAHVLHFDRLSAGERQPFLFSRGSVLTWDGRLDNREDLLLCLHRELGPDQSDAALVAAAYERWSLDALPRLIGDWCLAIWDAQHERVVLARDYMGNRTLYYRAEPTRLVWATRLEALAVCENLLGMPDDTYIAAYLTGGVPPDIAPFTGASPLLAGHVLIGTRNGTTARRYWTYSPSTVRYRGLDQYAAHLRMLLTEAVRVRLRSTRKVWAHLSGGWDSSTVVCLAHRLIERRCVEAPTIQPVSMVFDDVEMEVECAFMAAVERWCGIETMPLRYRGRPMFADMVGHKTLMPTFDGFDLQMPAAAAGDRVVLTGNVGDITMGVAGSLAALWEPFDNGHLLTGLRGFATYAHAKSIPLANLLLHALRLRFGRVRANSNRTSSGLAWRRSLPPQPGSFDGIPPALLARVRVQRQIELPPSDAFPRAYQHVVNGFYRLADNGTLMSTPEWLTPVTLKTHPFTHRPLIEFLLAIPSLALFDPLFARAGMRRALTDILPQAILERATKVGLPATACRRSRRAQLELVKDAVPLTDPATEWRIVQRGVVASKRLAHEISSVRTGQLLSKFLYDCICIEAWLRSLSHSSSSIGSQPSALVISSDVREWRAHTALTSSERSLAV